MAEPHSCSNFQRVKPILYVSHCQSKAVTCYDVDMGNQRMKKILFVEDDPTISIGVDNALSMNGYDVHHFCSSEEALLMIDDFLSSAVNNSSTSPTSGILLETEERGNSSLN